MGKLRDAKLIFDPTLFCDAEDIDTGRHADYIIARVLDFGYEKDCYTRSGPGVEER